MGGSKRWGGGGGPGEGRRMGREEQGREGRAGPRRAGGSLEAASSCRPWGARSGERSTWSQAPQHLVSARGGGRSPATQGSSPGHAWGRRRPAAWSKEHPPGGSRQDAACARWGRAQWLSSPRPPRPTHAQRTCWAAGASRPPGSPGRARRPPHLGHQRPPADPCPHPRPKPAPRTSGSWSWGLAAPPAGTCPLPRPRRPVPAGTG